MTRVCWLHISPTMDISQAEYDGYPATLRLDACTFLRQKKLAWDTSKWKYAWLTGAPHMV
eukprot:m.333561 g.333561  ORF g.333561 m.333561 type:complete len:60 (-) comp16063_c3_seq1:1112-1291(-)